MKGAIGNAFILNMVITFIIIFFMLLIGSVAYSKAYKVNKYLLDSLMDYVEYVNTVDNQKNICFTDNCNSKVDINWSDKVNEYLHRSGYILSNGTGTCPSVAGHDSDDEFAFVYPDDVDDKSPYVLKRNTKEGEYDYCIYQKRYYEKNKADDIFTKKRYTYKVLSYMKFDFPIIGEFIKLPIVSESKVVVNFH